MRAEAVSIHRHDVELGGVLRLPDAPGRHPVVTMIHGSLEQDRHGNLLRYRDDRAVPPHPFFDELGSRLVSRGFGALSWDKRGFATGVGADGTYWDQAEDARAVLDLLGNHPEADADRRFVFGQSAGVFVASILAGTDDRPRAYVLSGGLGSSFKHMMRARYGRLARFVAESEERLAWVEANFPADMAMAANVGRVIAAVDEGVEHVRFDYKGETYERQFPARTWDEEIHSKMARNVQAPALVVHGTADNNVPPQDADLLVAAMRDAGNPNVRQVMIEGADHSFQLAPASEAEWVREQISLQCFLRPYVENYFDAIADFLREWC